MSFGTQKQDILLESGTNEVEIAEFTLCGQYFGINVAKIREFIPFSGMDIIKIPGRHDSVIGMFMLREKAIPLIDLNKHLDIGQKEDLPNQVIVVTEFNNLTSAYIADEIKSIHRISWASFKPLGAALEGQSSQITGSIQVEGHEVLILDLESLVGEIFPTSVINYDESKFIDAPKEEQRGSVRLFFAEDSGIIRSQVSKILNSVGYTHLRVFKNGKDAYEAIKEVVEGVKKTGEPLGRHLSLLLTDIEMPQMDGLSLCRSVKQEMKLDIPVVMFSSLINEQMALKCKAVGADSFAAKPDTEKLIDIIDMLSLPK